MITVVGWPRSGTHWLKAMLEHALDEDLAHSHFWPEGEGEYVLIVRDPRDAFASHWRLYQHDYPDTQQTELGFVDYFMRGDGIERAWGCGWVPHTLKLMKLSVLYPLVYYEGLYAQPEKILTWVLAEMGKESPRIAEAVRWTEGLRCDPSGLPVENEMGKPGKWKVQLQPGTVRAIRAYCGEVMKELGYVA